MTWRFICCISYVTMPYRTGIRLSHVARNLAKGFPARLLGGPPALAVFLFTPCHTSNVAGAFGFMVGLFCPDFWLSATFGFCRSAAQEYVHTNLERDFP